MFFFSLKRECDRDIDWYNSHACTGSGHASTGWVNIWLNTIHASHTYTINALRLWLNRRLRWLTERLTHAKRKAKGAKRKRNIFLLERSMWNTTKFLHIADRRSHNNVRFVYLFSVLWSFLVESHQIKLDTRTQKIFFFSLSICVALPLLGCAMYGLSKNVACSKYKTK